MRIVTVRTAKNKGSQFEMDCEYSLRKKYPDIHRLGGEGQYREIDLESKQYHCTFECKRHAGFNWNELIKIFNKLEKRSPEGSTCYLLFKGNRQPCLVMQRSLSSEGPIYVDEFDDAFSIKFEKHKTEKKK